MPANNEREVIMYAKIGSPEGLSTATSVESQQQYETQYENGAKCRIRTVNNKDPVYTFKIKNEGESKLADNKEYHVAVDKDFFKGFKDGVASHWLNKRRYIFERTNVTMPAIVNGVLKTVKLPSLDYEVDVYFKSDGTMSPWCKIELEVDRLEEAIRENSDKNINIKLNVSGLAFMPQEVILMATATEEQKAFVKRLWEEEFRLPIK